MVACLPSLLARTAHVRRKGFDSQVLYCPDSEFMFCSVILRASATSIGRSYGPTMCVSTKRTGKMQ